MKKVFVLCIAVLMGCTSVYAQETIDRGIFNHLGLNVSASTEGIGVGVAAPITDYLEFGVDVNFMPSFKIKGDVNVDFNVPQLPVPLPTYDKVKLTGDLSRTTFDAKLSIYPFGNRASFFIVGGLSFGGQKLGVITGHSDAVQKAVTDYPEYKDLILSSISAELDKYSVQFDERGDIRGDIRVKKVRPYVGLGVGRLVPKRRVGFRFEAGCQFMGKMEVYQNDKLVNILQYTNSNDDLSKFIDKWSIYPVLKLTITGRIL
jgi:hypothetical protein